jgi:hypothetical protein
VNKEKHAYDWMDKEGMLDCLKAIATPVINAGKCGATTTALTVTARLRSCSTACRSLIPVPSSKAVLSREQRLLPFEEP